jgi:hypothetical protein
VSRTVGIEIEYADAEALGIVRRLPDKWRWSTDCSVRNSDGEISSQHQGIADKTIVGWFNRGGEVKTHPYLEEVEVKASVHDMLEVLRSEGAVVNRSCALQVHVGLPAGLAPRDAVRRPILYIARHGARLYEFFGTPEFRQRGLSKLVDTDTLRFLEYCDFEPGAIQGSWKAGRSPHPNAKFVHWWALRRVLINVSAVWRLGTWEFRAWASSLDDDAVLRAIGQALAVAEDFVSDRLDGFDLPTMQRRVEAWMQ